MVKPKTLAIFIIYLFVLPLVFAQNTQFTAPEPPQSKLLESRTDTIGGRKIATKVYETSADPRETIKYYREFFDKNDAEIIMDKSNYRKIMLRGRKNDYVISISAMLKKKKIIIGQYLQPEGDPPIEKLKLSWAEALTSFSPTEDGPGDDSAIIPRPPDSIRGMGIVKPTFSSLGYSSKRSLEEIVAFYKERMTALGWKLLREAPVQALVEFYNNIPEEQKGKQTLPFQDKLLAEAIKSAVILTFGGYSGIAEIAISRNITEKGGSEIAIRYRKIKR